MVVNKWKIAVQTLAVWLGISALAHIFAATSSNPVYMDSQMAIFGMWSLFILILGIIRAIRLKRWIVFLEAFGIYIVASIVGAFLLAAAIIFYLFYTFRCFYSLEENRLQRKQKTVADGNMEEQPEQNQ